jgi:hypothetical protein
MLSKLFIRPLTFSPCFNQFSQQHYFLFFFPTINFFRQNLQSAILGQIYALTKNLIFKFTVQKDGAVLYPSPKKQSGFKLIKDGVMKEVLLIHAEEHCVNCMNRGHLSWTMTTVIAPDRLQNIRKSNGVYQN